MRLFIAVQLNDPMKQFVQDVQADFRAQHIRGNYSPIENLHLTLAFIGEYSDPDAVLDVMETVSFSPFTVTMNEVGCFGDIWWTGFEDNEALEALARRLKHALSDAGIPFDRKRFKAHCTFLRRPEYPAGRRPVPAQFEPVSMRVESISLMRSDRGKHGMIYTEVGSVEAE